MVEIKKVVQVFNMAKFTDENGKFKSNYEKGKVGYIIELMEWIYEHNNMTYDEKLDYLLKLEEVHENHLKEVFPAGNYRWDDRWSDKLIKSKV
jgi:hypothetical protein